MPMDESAGLGKEQGKSLCINQIQTWPPLRNRLGSRNRRLCMSPYRGGPNAGVAAICRALRRSFFVDQEPAILYFKILLPWS